MASMARSAALCLLLAAAFVALASAQDDYIKQVPGTTNIRCTVKPKVCYPNEPVGWLTRKYNIDMYGKAGYWYNYGCRTSGFVSNINNGYRGLNWIWNAACFKEPNTDPTNWGVWGADMKNCTMTCPAEKYCMGNGCFCTDFARSQGYYAQCNNLRRCARHPWKCWGIRGGGMKSLINTLIFKPKSDGKCMKNLDMPEPPYNRPIPWPLGGPGYGPNC